jgi:hypothetical protein
MSVRLRGGQRRGRWKGGEGGGRRRSRGKREASTNMCEVRPYSLE